ncbi:cytochrome c, partial [Candidatus Binatia bacterium]|nr:cytochrome c [Candidatus Binatia bacterium]
MDPVDRSRRCALADGIRPSRRSRLPARALLPLVLLVVACVAAADTGDEAGARLAAELGCAGCHAGLDVSVETRGRAPDLAFAGARWQPGYLFAYLRDPQRVRRHVGASRMPDFRLTEEEALALTLFLAAQRATPAPPDAARAAA